MLKFFKKSTTTSQEGEQTAQSFTVKGMRCNHCKANVEKAIASLPKVSHVSIELSSGQVKVQGTVSAKKVCDAVSALGFEIDQTH